ncbi:rhodopsin-like [Rhopilema esculentum]|uniref:rhodopsin-like n=1 Tax=Rhopilema esculentum TaxID=499914 RepID=UPI0031D06E81|eukprot:gene17703-9361_t
MRVNDTFNCWGLKHPLTKTLATNVIIFLTIDCVIAFATVVGNSISIFILLRAKYLRTPSYILLGALSVSDVLMGIAAQPMYIMFCFLLKFKRTIDVALLRKTNTLLNLCVGLKLTYIALISLDRYHSISNVSIYYKTASCKRYLIVALVCGGAWIQASTIGHFYAEDFEYVKMLYFLIVFIIITYSFARVFVEIVSYELKLLEVRGRARRSTTPNRQEVARYKREKRKTYTAVMLVSVFSLCSMPYISNSIHDIIREQYCWDDQDTFIRSIWCNFFMMLNSFLCPFIYKTNKDINAAYTQMTMPSSTREG